MSRALTEPETRFAHEYVRLGNKTRAAFIAYNVTTVGSAAAYGCRVAHRPAVSRLICKLVEDEMEKRGYGPPKPEPFDFEKFLPRWARRVMRRAARREEKRRKLGGA